MANSCFDRLSIKCPLDNIRCVDEDVGVKGISDVRPFRKEAGDAFDVIAGLIKEATVAEALVMSAFKTAATRTDASSAECFASMDHLVSETLPSGSSVSTAVIPDAVGSELSSEIT